MGAVNRGCRLFAWRWGQPAGPPAPQGLGEFAVEFSTALDVEGLVDRLVRHAHLRVDGQVPAELVGYLLRAPAPFQTLLNVVTQPRTPADLPGLGARSAGIGTGLGDVRPVGPLGAAPSAPLRRISRR